MSEKGAIIGKLHKHVDRHVDMEFARVITAIQKQHLSLERAMDPQVMARAIAKHFPSDILLNLERFMRGEREAKRLHFRNDQNAPTIQITKLAGSTANVIQTDAGGPGAHLTAAGAWNNGCSRKLKRRFEKVDIEGVAARLKELPVKEWEYKEATDGRHLGPTAEDFYAAFGLGDSPETLNTVDLAAVAVLGVQYLLSRVQKLERKIARLEKRRKK